MTQALSHSILQQELIRVIQDPKLSQVGQGKAVQVNIQIVGDSAIDKAAVQNGDIRAAMRYILSCLPQPREMWLKALAMAVIYEHTQSVDKTADYLGRNRSRLYSKSRDGNHWFDRIKAINSGEIELVPQNDNGGTMG